MRPSCLLLIPLLASATAVTAAEPAPAAKPARAPDAPSEFIFNINAFVGAKVLKHDDWDPVDGQGAFGVEFDMQHQSWPVALAVNVIGSGGTHENDDTNVTTSGSTGELQLGVRKTWDTPGLLRFSIAGGLDLVSAATKVETPSTTTKEDGGGVGFWVSGGIYWTIARHFNIGPQVAFSAARVELDDRDVQAGGIFLGVILGGCF
jgi:hypothetical protein